MDSLRIKLAAFVLFAVLCVVITYWGVTLSRGVSQPIATASLPAPPSVASAEQLFGAQAEKVNTEQLRVIGILALGPGRGAAAIIGSSDGSTRTLAAGQAYDRDTRVAEVRSGSVVLERGHSKSELFLAKPEQSQAYVR